MIARRLYLAPALLLFACSDVSELDDAPLDIEGGESGALLSHDAPTVLSDDPMLRALNDGESGDWELAPHQAVVAEWRSGEEWDAVTEWDAEEAAVLAENDPTWYANSGERYTALFVTDTGRTYGRIGEAPEADRLPSVENLFGASPDHPEELGEMRPGPGEAGFAPFGPDAESGFDDGFEEREGIGTDCSTDPRYRYTAGLTSIPRRLIGAMSSSGNTRSGACTGNKVGPRAVLTASHCVMSPSGVVTFTGRWNPGQTNSTTPNGSIPRSGVFLRDYRPNGNLDYDYAVFFLQNTQAVYNLGWFGMSWSTSSSWYTNKTTYLKGYPCGSNMSCGQTSVQCCKASPLAGDLCDGYMYGDTDTLTSGAKASNNTLKVHHAQSPGQSGSAIYDYLGGSYTILGIVNGADNPNNGGTPCTASSGCYGPRLRSNMWNDVCSWIGNNSFQSSWGSHPLCP